MGDHYRRFQGPRMFEDFDKSAAAKEGRGRMGASLLISAVLCVGIAGAVAAAIATAHVVVRKRQSDTAVTFEDLPRVAPPKPKMVAKGAAARKARKVSARAAMVAIKAIPTERPEEAEGELAEAGDVGPTDLVIEEKAPPPIPSAPPPKLPPPEEASDQVKEAIAQPEFLAGCRAPEIPEALHSAAATIQIDVRMLISVDGKVQSAKVIKSHPLIPDDVVLRCVREQTFKPAQLPDGTAVVYPFHRRFVFKPTRA